MRLFEDFKILFEQPDWFYDPQLCFIDTVLDCRSVMINNLKNSTIV